MLHKLFHELKMEGMLSFFEASITLISKLDITNINF
jgi:hypothetical protein